MTVTKRTRFEVLKRDNHTCRYCGGKAPDVQLHVDHVNPTALGGPDTADNLVAACVDCNLGKASSHPDSSTVADVSADAIRWAAAIKEAARIDSEAHNVHLEYRGQLFDRIDEYDGFPLPANWEQSIIAFYQAGLPIESLLDCVDVAATAYGVYPNNRFRYMCGVAWKRVARLQEIAKSLLESDPG
jgi:hypothetical protein